METPGDKTDLDKIVPDISIPALSETDAEFSLPLLAPAEVSSVLQQTTSGVNLEEMGVISHLPVSFLSATLPPLSSKPEIFQQQTLEQATLEDYYGQSKYYETLYPVPQQQNIATFQTTSEAGPSGFQTIKSKSASSTYLKKKKTEQKKNHVCPQCHKTFSTGEKLRRHYKNHQESREGFPFKCDQCKKTFTSKFKLVRHALIHSDKKPFSCSVCDRTFHRKDHLKNHIKVHSPTKRLYQCDNCKKQYTSLMSFRKHKAVHSAEEGNLTCQICSEIFNNKEQIIYHLKVHAGSRTIKNPSEKKYLCDYCDRRFYTKKDVKRHLVVHTGMRDFLCQFCPQRFGRKDHLVRHIKKSHNKDYTEQTSIQGSEESLATQKPETITSGALLNLTPVFKEDDPDSFFEEIRPPKSPEIKKEFKSELDLAGVKTIFEEEDVLPLEEEDIYRSGQSTQSDLKELLVTDIFKKIEKLPVGKSNVSLWHNPEEIKSSPSTTTMQFSDTTTSFSRGQTSSQEEILVPPLVPTNRVLKREDSSEPSLPTLVPFLDPSVALPPLKIISIQKQLELSEQTRPLPDPNLPLPPLRIRPGVVPRSFQKPPKQQEEEQKIPLPGFSQTFQPPPS